MQNQDSKRSPARGLLSCTALDSSHGQLGCCPICRSVRREHPARGNTGPLGDRLQGGHVLRSDIESDTKSDPHLILDFITWPTL